MELREAPIQGWTKGMMVAEGMIEMGAPFLYLGRVRPEGIAILVWLAETNGGPCRSAE